MDAPENFDHDTPLPATCNLQLGLGALPCDAYHHFYHYQSSAQYTLLARTCFMLGLQDEAKAALTKAIFQDHFNPEALAMKAAVTANSVPQSYDKHPLSDAAFRASVGLPADEVALLHDSALALRLNGDVEGAARQFSEALVLAPDHSNSHFGLARCLFAQADYQQAQHHLQEAVRLSHTAHDAYHRSASAEHVKRARDFAARGENELAINDYTKALDLHRGNTEATQAREQLQAQRK